MVMCWAPDCNHYNVRERCKFMQFPKDPIEKEKWRKFVRRFEEPGAHLCSCHFPGGKLENGPTLYKHNINKRLLILRLKRRNVLKEANRHRYNWVPPSSCFGTFQWMPSYGGAVPQDAVHAGMDRDGGPIFVGRAFHDGDLLPAKVCPSHGCAFISYGGNEISKSDYEVLVSNHVAWKYARGGDVPPEAIRIGQTCDGEGLFMGRTMLEGTMTPGKVHPSHGCLYVPFNGQEERFSEYEVLVLS